MLIFFPGCHAKPLPDDITSPIVLVTETGEQQMPAAIRVAPASTVTLDARYNLKLENLFNFTLEGDYLYANFLENDDAVGWAIMNTVDGQMCISGETKCKFSALPKRYEIRFETGRATNRVFVYDWQTHQEMLIPNGDNPWNPDIDGAVVVWQQRVPDGWRVAGYNVETCQSYMITESQGYISDVHIAGEWVGYVERVNAQSTVADIYVSHLTAQDQVHVAEIIYYESAHWEPYALGNGRIAWIKSIAAGGNEVHILDLITHQDKLLNDNDSECVATDVLVLDDMAIWTCIERRYGMDLANDQLFDVPLFPPDIGFTGGTVDFLASSTRLVWILPSATEALPLQIYTAPIVRK